MKSPQIFFETFLSRNVLEGLDVTLPKGAVVAFHVEGTGGGDWQVVRSTDGITISVADQVPKDCEMWCSAETFMLIVTGELRSSRAFLNGDLRIAGDVGLALKVETLLREAA